jgi:Uma2 family endonuclease
MRASAPFARVSVEDYLAEESSANLKHDYVDGALFAMAGGSVRHNQIASNVMIALGAQLRGTPCRPFNSDMKIRIRLPNETRFYYPDLSIVCRSNADTDDFQDHPLILIEILSESTRRVDQGEKKHAYLMIPSLHAYLMIEQDAAAGVVHRRHQSGFAREVYEGEDAVIALQEAGASLALRDVYEGLSSQPSLQH